MWFDRLDKMPRRGSLEWMLALAVWSARRDEEYLFRYSLVLAAALDRESDAMVKDFAKAWDEFSDAYYPFQSSAREKRVEKMKEIWEKSYKGPMLVKPLALRRRIKRPGRGEKK